MALARNHEELVCRQWPFARSAAQPEGQPEGLLQRGRIVEVGVGRLAREDTFDVVARLVVWDELDEEIELVGRARRHPALDRASATVVSPDGEGGMPVCRAKLREQARAQLDGYFGSLQRRLVGGKAR